VAEAVVLPTGVRVDVDERVMLTWGVAVDVLVTLPLAGVGVSETVTLPPGVVVSEPVVLPLGVGVSETVTLPPGVVVSETVGVGVADRSLQGAWLTLAVLMVLLPTVTAPFKAKSLPVIVEPLFTVIEV
jgi:hypothetical protein